MAEASTVIAVLTSVWKNTPGPQPAHPLRSADQIDVHSTSTCVLSAIRFVSSGWQPGGGGAGCSGVCHLGVGIFRSTWLRQWVASSAGVRQHQFIGLRLVAASVAVIQFLSAHRPLLLETVRPPGKLASPTAGLNSSASENASSSLSLVLNPTTGPAPVAPVLDARPAPCSAPSGLGDMRRTCAEAAQEAAVPELRRALLGNSRRRLRQRRVPMPPRFAPSPCRACRLIEPEEVER